MTLTTRVVDLGAGVGVTIHEVTGGGTGPVVAVLGGVHGDEYEGQVATRMLLAEVGDGAFRGTVRIVPEANPSAVLARTRTTPEDGRNLAREFPGDPRGDLTQRVAHVLTEQVIDGASLLVDLHSAGRDFRMPMFVGYHHGQDPVVAEAARRFGAPLNWVHEGYTAGRSLSVALDRGISCLYVEGSGGGGLLGDEVDTYFGGMLRILELLGMRDSAPVTSVIPQQLIGGDGNVDASIPARADGWCVTRVAAGEVIEAEHCVAEIMDGQGRVVDRILAPQRSIVMMLRCRADVRAGDLVVMLAAPPVGVSPG